MYQGKPLRSCRPGGRLAPLRYGFRLTGDRLTLRSYGRLGRITGFPTPGPSTPNPVFVALAHGSPFLVGGLVLGSAAGVRPLAAVYRNLLICRSFLTIGFADGGGGYSAAAEAGEDDDGEDVGEHP